VDKITLTQLFVWVPTAVSCCQFLLYKWSMFICISSKNGQWVHYKAWYLPYLESSWNSN